MDKRGWDEPDIIFLSGNAYVDHPAWATAILGRFLEHRGFKVGIIAQLDWYSTKDISSLGQPRLFLGYWHQTHPSYECSRRNSGP